MTALMLGSSKSLDRAMFQVEANMRLFKENGLLKEDVATVFARVKPVLTDNMLDEVNNCDFVVESAPEKLELKKAMFSQLDSCRPDIIIASNTSSCPVASFTEGCRTANRMIGVHYFNPAHIMPLVEIHYSPATSQQTIDTTRQLMTRTKKKPVVLKKDVFGLLGTRIQLAMAREVEALLAEGVASPEDIDVVASASYGFRFACMGVLEAWDMVGLDTMVAIEKRIFGLLDNGTGPKSVLTDMVDRGDLGVKSGRGWFDYSKRTRESVLEGQSKRLLKQLALYREFNT
jgi:3-hydroxyacyl-CoA dehydrogenase